MMKKAFFWALLLTVSMTACKGGKTESAATEEKEPAVGLAVDESSFPDPALRGVIAKTSSGEDDILTDYELDDFWNLDVNYEDVASLQGIELLPNLQSLHANAFQGAAIDVSKNTKLTEIYCCDSPKLTSLTLGEQPELTTLNINNTNISNIDLTKCPKLETLRMKGTPIGAVDLSGCPELKEIECDAVLMPGLDLSACPNAGFVD
ncbi:MAG: hypothetical protein K6B13_12940 [Prevotella sp.]|jgi:hypothetical protein|nr:hypothetical protein [Prevotella sp.]